jgi:hypothetical protein
VIYRSALSQDVVGNCRDLLQAIVRGVKYRQFYPARIFRIIFGITNAESHVTLDRKKISEKTACQHDD